MSGGSNPVKKVLGKGDAWKEEGWAKGEGTSGANAGHKAVIKHAKKLGYPGKIAPAGSSKAVWTAFTKKFNAWKAGGMKGAKKPGGAKKPAPKPAPKPATPAKPAPPKAGTKPGLGPYPENNVFFPMLNKEYTAPNAMNLAAYTPPNPYNNGQLLGGAKARYDQAVFPGVYDDKGGLDMTKDVGKPDYSDIQGLLYQPHTTEYQQAFVDPNLWNYQPPMLKTGPVQYMGNPYFNVPSASAASGGGKKKKKKKAATTTPTDDEQTEAQGDSKAGGDLSGGFPGNHAGGLGSGWGDKGEDNSGGHPDHGMSGVADY